MTWRNCQKDCFIEVFTSVFAFLNREPSLTFLLENSIAFLDQRMDTHFSYTLFTDLDKLKDLSVLGKRQNPLFFSRVPPTDFLNQLRKWILL